MTVLKETLQNVSFTRDFKSRFMLPLRMTFDQGGVTRHFDLSISHCSVAILLYHKERKEFLTVRQFRPAVFVGRISRLPENKGKPLEEIDWSRYSTELGYTVELCAGLVDKDLPLVDIAREEIEEECGYAVPDKHIHQIATYTLHADESGSTQYLFYAEIDDSMKISEGGGNAAEGESITKVFISEQAARSCLEDHESQGPPGALYAFQWWFHRDQEKKKIPGGFVWQPEVGPSMENLRFVRDLGSMRHKPARMTFELGNVCRIWDMAMQEDNVAVLIYNKSSQKVVLTQRFRPAVLIGRTMHSAVNKGKLPEDIDWKSVNPRLAYTLEMCCTHSNGGGQMEKALECIRLKLGYKVKELQFVTSFVAETDNDCIMEKLERRIGSRSGKAVEDVVPVSFSSSELWSLTHQPSPISPPGVFFMIEWFMAHHKDK